MPKVICKLPNASDEISGVKFSATEDGFRLSEEISDEAAELFLSVPGYELAVVDPAAEAVRLAAAAEAAAAAAQAAQEAAQAAAKAAVAPAKAPAKTVKAAKAAKAPAPAPAPAPVTEPTEPATSEPETPAGDQPPVGDDEAVF